jgi:hypothetical protein
LAIAGVHPRPVYDIDWSSADELVTAGGDDTIRIFRNAFSCYHKKACTVVDISYNYRYAEENPVLKAITVFPLIISNVLIWILELLKREIVMRFLFQCSGSAFDGRQDPHSA